MKCKLKQSTVKLFKFESLRIGKSLRQDVFKHLSLRNKDLHRFKRQSLSLFGITYRYKIQQLMELNNVHSQGI